MKRWTLRTLVIAVFAGSAYLVWHRTLERRAMHLHNAQQPPPLAIGAVEDPVEAAVLFVNDEFMKPQTAMPSPAVREKLRIIAERGQTNTDVVLTLELWLKQLFNDKHAEGEEFREMARALLVADPNVASRAVKNHYNAQDEVSSRFAEDMLIAFGKQALPALMGGLRDEAGHAAFVKSPGKSRLPAVLAKLGKDAVPALAAALDDPSPHVRGQAAAALKLMDPATVPPDVLKLIDVPK